MADDRHSLTMPVCFGAEDAEAILGVVVSDALDQASQHLMVRAAAS